MAILFSLFLAEAWRSDTILAICSGGARAGGGARVGGDTRLVGRRMLPACLYPSGMSITGRKSGACVRGYLVLLLWRVPVAGIGSS